MSTRRFLAYFVAVSACSTVAFASTLMGAPAPPQAVNAADSLQAAHHPARPVAPVRHVRPAVRAILMAQAD